MLRLCCAALGTSTMLRCALGLAMEWDIIGLPCHAAATLLEGLSHVLSRLSVDCKVS